MVKFITLTLGFVLVTAIALAGRYLAASATQEAALAPLATLDISLAQSQEVLAAALAEAEEQGTQMDIAIVDAGGNLKGFARMDGAWLGSIDISMKKASHGPLLRHEYRRNRASCPSPVGRSTRSRLSNGGLITFPGGVPIKAADGTVIGAIGVSGSTVENDHTVARRPWPRWGMGPHRHPDPPSRPQSLSPRTEMESGASSSTPRPIRRIIAGAGVRDCSSAIPISPEAQSREGRRTVEASLEKKCSDDGVGGPFLQEPEVRDIRVRGCHIQDGHRILQRHAIGLHHAQAMQVCRLLARPADAIGAQRQVGPVVDPRSG